jgi:hypothetical protein
VKTSRPSSAFAQMSAWISSAAACQRSALDSSSRRRASRAPRSAATQHISFDDVKCLGSPRTSQMPRSGSRQAASAASTWRFRIGHIRSGRWSRDFTCR